MKKDFKDFSAQFAGKPIPPEALVSDEFVQALCSHFVQALCSHIVHFIRKREPRMSEYDADDIAQRAAMNVIRAAGEPGCLIMSLKAFSEKVARNAIADFGRKKKLENLKRERMRRDLERLLGNDSSQEMPGSQDQDDRSGSAATLMRSVREKLSRKHRQILDLYQEGKTFTEIAAILGIPMGTVNSRFYYMRKCFERQCELREEG